MGGYRRFCVQCGGELKQGARFCPNCGRLAANSPQPAVTGEHDLGRDLQAPPPSPAWDATAAPPDGALFPPPGSGYPPQDAPFPLEGSGLVSEGSRVLPEGHGYRREGQGLPPGGPPFPPEGHGFPPEGHGFPPEGPLFPRDDTAADLPFPRDDPPFPQGAAADGPLFPGTASPPPRPAGVPVNGAGAAVGLPRSLGRASGRVRVLGAAHRGEIGLPGARGHGPVLPELDERRGLQPAVGAVPRQPATWRRPTAIARVPAGCCLLAS